MSFCSLNEIFKIQLDLKTILATKKMKIFNLFFGNLISFVYKILKNVISKVLFLFSVLELKIDLIFLSQGKTYKTKVYSIVFPFY